jgi:SWI/SNF-related matrix-associated actin-dependent regulator 1 of chromatin subfamily A
MAISSKTELQAQWRALLPSLPADVAEELGVDLWENLSVDEIRQRFFRAQAGLVSLEAATSVRESLAGHFRSADSYLASMTVSESAEPINDFPALLCAIENLPLAVALKKNLGDLAQAADSLARMLGLPFVSWQSALVIQTWPTLTPADLQLKFKVFQNRLNQAVKGKIFTEEMKRAFGVLQSKFTAIVQLVTKQGWQPLPPAESATVAEAPAVPGEKKQRTTSFPAVETAVKEAAKLVLEKPLGDVEVWFAEQLQNQEIAWQEAAVLRIVLAEQLQRYRSSEARDQFLIKLYQGSVSFKSPVPLTGEVRQRVQIFVQLFSSLHGLSSAPAVLAAERAMALSPSWLWRDIGRQSEDEEWLVNSSDQVLYFDREASAKAGVYASYLNKPGVLVRGGERVNFEFEGKTVFILGHEFNDFCKQVLCHFFESVGTIPSMEIVSAMRIVLGNDEVSLQRLMDGAGVSRESYKDALRWLYSHGKGNIRTLATANTEGLGERGFLLSAYAEYLRWLVPLGGALATDDVERIISEMPQGQILYLRDRQYFFDFGHNENLLLTEVDKRKILKQAYGEALTEKCWETSDSLMALVSGYFNTDGRFKWMEFAKLPQNQLATLGHGLIDYASQVSGRLPGKVLEMFSAVLARMGFSRTGESFLQDVFDSDAYQHTRAGCVLELYSQALAYVHTGELEEKAQASPIYRTLKQRFGITVSQYLPKQSQTSVDAREEMRGKREMVYQSVFMILDRYLSQKYGPHYALTEAAFENYAEQGANDVFTEFGRRHYMRDYLNHPGKFGYSLQVDGLRIAQGVAKARYEAQSPIISALQFKDAAAVDAAVDRLFIDNNVWQHPEYFAELFCGPMANHFWAIKLTSGQTLHATYADLWQAANSLASIKGDKASRMLSPERMGGENTETGYIPSALRLTVDEAKKTRIDLLSQWVQEERMTLPDLEEKLRQVKEKGRLNIAVTLNQIFPQTYVGVVEAGDKTYKCLYRVGDLFEKLGIPGNRATWYHSDFELFRLVGLMGGETAPLAVSRFTNPFPLESVSDDEFMGLFSRALFSRAGLTSITTETIQNYLHRYVFGVVTTQQESLVEAYHATQDSDELTKSMALAPTAIRKIIAGEYDLMSKDVRERWLKIFLSRVLKIQGNDLTDERLTVAQKRISDGELAAFILDTVVQDHELNLADASGIGRFIQKFDLSLPLQVLGEQPRSLLILFRIFYPDVLKRYQPPELLQALMETMPDEESSLADQESVLQLLDWLNQKLKGRAGPISSESDVMLDEMIFDLMGNWIERDSQSVMDFLHEFSRQVDTTPILATLCCRLAEKINAYTAGFVMPLTMKFNSDPENYIGPKRYQQEAVHQIIYSERKNWLLADEPGMGKSYQAILLAESLGAKRVLWVTTASNRKTIQEEILAHTHLSMADVMLVSGNGAERKAQLEEAMTQKYTVISYQTLRKLRLDDPTGYAALTKDLDLRIIDETQRADNEFSQQGREVQRLKAKNTLLLSATPYQHDIRKLWPILKMLDSVEFNDKTHKTFMQSFLEGTGDDYIKMHKVLSQYMIRRRKKDYYREPDASTPADQQRDTLAKQVTVPYQLDGTYVMSDEQAEAYLAIMASDEPITVAKIRQLFRVLFDPASHGVEAANDRVLETRRLVKKHILEGKKIILWAHHHDSIDQLKVMLKELSGELKREFPARFGDGIGYGQFDGRSESLAEVTYGDEDMARRDYDRIRFQKEKEPQVMIAGLEAGAEGLTFTAADVAIFYERPMMFTRMKQAYDRNHRVDGKFHRHELLYYHMVATFPPHLLDRIRDPRLKRLLQQGSVDEILLRRLHERGRWFDMVMDGLMDDDVVTSGLFAQIKKDLSVSFEMGREDGDATLKPAEETSQSPYVEQWQARLLGMELRPMELKAAFDGDTLASFQAFAMTELPRETLTAIDDLLVLSDSQIVRYQLESLLHSVAWAQRQGTHRYSFGSSQPWLTAAGSANLSPAQKVLVLPIFNLMATYNGKHSVLDFCEKIVGSSKLMSQPELDKMLSFLTALNLVKDDSLVEALNSFLQKQGDELAIQKDVDWFDRFGILISCGLGAALKSALALDTLTGVGLHMDKSAWDYLQRQCGVNDLASLKLLLADSPYAAMHVQKVLSKGASGADKYNRYLKSHADDLHRTAVKQTATEPQGNDAWAGALVIKEASIGNLKTFYQVKEEDKNPDIARRWKQGVGHWMREILNVIRLQYGERVAFALSQYTHITDETYRKKFADSYAEMVRTLSSNERLPDSAWAWRHRFGFSGFAPGQKDQDLLGMRLVAQVMALAENLLQDSELKTEDVFALLGLRNRFFAYGSSADVFVAASDDLLTFQDKLAFEQSPHLQVVGQSFGENLALEAFRSNDAVKLRTLFTEVTSGQTHMLRVFGAGTQPGFAAIHLMTTEGKAPIYVLDMLPGGQNISCNRAVVEHMAERAKRHGDDLPYLTSRQPIVGMAQKARMTAHALPGSRTHDFNWSQNRVVARPVDYKERVSVLPYSARSLSRPVAKRVSKIGRRF